jgi:hypothetical protein
MDAFGLWKRISSKSTSKVTSIQLCIQLSIRIFAQPNIPRGAERLRFLIPSCQASVESQSADSAARRTSVRRCRRWLSVKKTCNAKWGYTKNIQKLIDDFGDLVASL